MQKSESEILVMFACAFVAGACFGFSMLSFFQTHLQKDQELKEAAQRIVDDANRFSGSPVSSPTISNDVVQTRTYGEERVLDCKQLSADAFQDELMVQTVVEDAETQSLTQYTYKA